MGTKTQVKAPARHHAWTRAVGRPQAGRAATTGRVLLGGYFVAMAMVNVFITLPSAESVYAGLADLTWPGFIWIPEQVIQPLAAPFTVVLVCWELLVAVLLLQRGRAARVGLWMVLAQMVALAPFLGWFQVPNWLTAALVLLLLRYEHQRNLLDLLRSIR
jgi:hypothetical protein